MPPCSFIKCSYFNIASVGLLKNRTCGHILESLKEETKMVALIIRTESDKAKMPSFFFFFERKLSSSITRVQMHGPLPVVKNDASKYVDLAKQGSKRWINSNPGEFAASFACSVTMQSNPDDMVARRGSLSIFSAFCQIYPEVI